MSFRRRAGGGKRDTAEGPIVEALRAIGAEVWHVGGQGNPDILTRLRGRYLPMEIKTGKGRRTKNQGDIPWPIVRTPEEAIQQILERREP